MFPQGGFIAAGDVLKQRFTLTCSDWQDDGFIDPTNLTEINEFDEELKAAATSLYYKFLLRKNGISVPVAEGGQYRITLRGCVCSLFLAVENRHCVTHFLLKESFPEASSRALRFKMI